MRLLASLPVSWRNCLSSQSYILCSSIRLPEFLKPRCSLCGLRRTVYTVTRKWEKQYTTAIREDLEKFWKDKLRNSHVNQNKGGDKYYVLSMFPYPSGRLHMGHVRVYTISDVMARYHRLAGKEVIHPMGWDAFGLPAENAAIERKELPDKWTYSNIGHMKKQIEGLCCSFDWDREFATCDPNYYKWTQYIFLKMLEAGLVYQKEAAVNWDPVDQTVLADEQIDENGCSWRSGAKAEKKLLKQWFIRTTAYSKALYEGLSEVDEDLWRSIIDLQKHWIGDCDGCRLEMTLEFGGHKLNDPLSVFTRTPEALYGASHILLSPEHPLNQPQYKKTGCDTDGVTCLNVEAVHPFTQKKLPMYVHEKWEFGPFLDSHLGFPSINEEDGEFAERHKIEFLDVIQSDGCGTETVINSDKLSYLDRKNAFEKAVLQLQAVKCGGHITSERGRDWLISRQRYWGTPIPIIHCPKYGAVPVPYDDLPVVLPNITSFTGLGTSPLAQAEEWIKVKCPGCDCGSHGYRETDTMDTFVDSSWYFLRYLDPLNQNEPFRKELAERYLPVDLYIGGKEHAIMHLYYARFVHHFLFEQGLVPTREPFVNLLTQGMVMGQSYRLQDSGRYLPIDQVDTSGEVPVERDSGAALVVEWEKMSKSKYNGVDPQDILEVRGCDTTRLCILSNVAPKSDRLWSEDVFSGVLHWQSRIWSLVTVMHDARAQGKPNSLPVISKEEEENIFNQRNYFINQVTYDMNTTFLLNAAISRLQGFTNSLKKISVNNDVLLGSEEFERALSELIIMVSPFAPMFCSELWSGLQGLPYKLTKVNWDKPLPEHGWPLVDAAYRLPLKVKRDSKNAFEVRLPMPVGESHTLTKSQAIELAQASPEYEKKIGDTKVQSISFRLVPGFKAEIFFLTGKKKKRLARMASQERGGKSKNENEEMTNS